MCDEDEKGMNWYLGIWYEGRFLFLFYEGNYKNNQKKLKSYIKRKRLMKKKNEWKRNCVYIRIVKVGKNIVWYEIKWYRILWINKGVNICLGW